MSSSFWRVGTHRDIPDLPLVNSCLIHCRWCGLIRTWLDVLWWTVREYRIICPEPQHCLSVTMDRQGEYVIHRVCISNTRGVSPTQDVYLIHRVSHTQGEYLMHYTFFQWLVRVHKISTRRSMCPPRILSWTHVPSSGRNVVYTDQGLNECFIL